MHVEALNVLPELREQLGLDDVVLVGYTATARQSRSFMRRAVRAGRCGPSILEAPHALTEEIGLKSIAAAKTAFETTNLRDRLARYHDDADGAFGGWNKIWLHPDFRAWNIENYLPSVTCPVLAIQGAADEYGTLAQIDAIERQVKGQFERVIPDRTWTRAASRLRIKATLDAAWRGFVTSV